MQELQQSGGGAGGSVVAPVPFYCDAKLLIHLITQPSFIALGFVQNQYPKRAFAVFYCVKDRLHLHFKQTYSLMSIVLLHLGSAMGITAKSSGLCKMFLNADNIGTYLHFELCSACG